METRQTFKSKIDAARLANDFTDFTFEEDEARDPRVGARDPRLRARDPQLRARDPNLRARDDDSDDDDDDGRSANFCIFLS